MTQPGVIPYPFGDLGLCAGARFTTTTEVYPHSDGHPAICNAAQVAAARAALDHALAQA